MVKLYRRLYVTGQLCWNGNNAVYLHDKEATCHGDMVMFTIAHGTIYVHVHATSRITWSSLYIASPWAHIGMDDGISSSYPSAIKPHSLSSYWSHVSCHMNTAKIMWSNSITSNDHAIQLSDDHVIQLMKSRLNVYTGWDHKLGRVNKDILEWLLHSLPHASSLIMITNGYWNGYCSYHHWYDSYRVCSIWHHWLVYYLPHGLVKQTNRAGMCVVIYLLSSSHNNTCQ